MEMGGNGNVESHSRTSLASGERCKLPQRDLGRIESQPKSILVHFSVKIWHLVATIYFPENQLIKFRAL